MTAKKTINSRAKGVRGEREFRTLIEQSTGVRLQRNQNQHDKGGYDLIVDPAFCTTPQMRARAAVLDEYAFEVKNTKEGFVPAHWKQAAEQGTRYGRTPVLAYKVPLKGWRVAVRARDLLSMTNASGGALMALSTEDHLLHMEPLTLFKAMGAGV